MHLHEQLARYGSLTLSHEELLTLILNLTPDDPASRMQVARLLRERGFRGVMCAEVGELCEDYGCSPALAARLVALAELYHRVATLSEELPMSIHCVEDAARLVLPSMSHLDYEQLRVLLLDTSNHVQANLVLYQGTLNELSARVAEVFRPAITRKAAAIIICHNHPSGNPEPSTEDLLFTRNLIEARDLLGIAVQDHLIIAGGGYRSALAALLRVTRKQDRTAATPLQLEPERDETIFVGTDATHTADEAATASFYHSIGKDGEA